MIHCPSCRKSFDPPAASRATATCPHCRRVIVLEDGESVGAPGDAGTAPFLEPLPAHEAPTQIGAASQTLSLPVGKRVSVAILTGPLKGDAVTLTRPTLTFGRASGPAADVVLQDPHLAPRHAALECHGSRIVLRDLGSQEGTFVGGHRISGPREVVDGDEFRLGDSTFLLLVADAEPPDR